MKLSEMTDDEAGPALLKAYRLACDCYDGESVHPSHHVNSWIKSVRDARKARDAAGNVGEAKEIERRDQAQDSAPSLDTRIGRNLTHTPNTPAVQALRAIPGYDRLVRRPLPPTQAPQDIFFKKA